MRWVRLDDPAVAAGGAGLQWGSYRSDGEGDAAAVAPFTAELERLDRFRASIARDSPSG
jgi:hypothetical protein